MGGRALGQAAPAASLAAAVILHVGAAHAGGYDTPMLYTARHMGMGGSAIGYVHDPSALFHNPAGLAHVRQVDALIDFSLLLGKLQGSPDVLHRDAESETTVAPLPFAGGAFRLNSWLSAGLGIFPSASSGATYRGPGSAEDTTKLLFLEATPALAVNLPGSVRLGLGYRVTFVRLERYQGDPESKATPFLDFKLSGYNFSGFRAGLQWTPRPGLEVGLAYRHRTATKVENEAGVALRTLYTDVSTEFVLPSKFGAGARYDLERYGPHLALAADLEYTLNSQNHGSPLRGTPPGQSQAASVPNVFEWQNSLTVRLGLEYRVLSDGTRDRVALRAGYIHDTRTANPSYPTAFGTPPSATRVVTAGAGYDFGSVQTNFALAYRFGGASVTERDFSGPDQKECAFCGTSGDYRIHLTGIYLDAGYSF